MSKIIYTESENKISIQTINVNTDIVSTDIDDVDYSKYADDDSDENMAELLDY